MKKVFAISSLIFVLLTVAVNVWARGGGGCFEEGTPVLTPHGEVPIEQLHVGDAVVGGVVQAVLRVEPESYLELVIADRLLHVTDEHPFQITPGIFREASRLDNVRRVSAKLPAYNLLVSPGGTYIAAGCVVHNKGCFLPDTPILRANGSEVWIRDVKPGDELLALTTSGEVVPTTVLKVLTHEVDEYLVVATEKSILNVTIEHPFYVGEGTFKTLEALRVGDSICAYDGHCLSAQRIESIARVRSQVRVYNLQTDAPNTFFANRIAVHNKGGGCFPAGTLVRTPGGEMAIETIHPGDVVLAGNGEATLVAATFVTQAPVLMLRTDTGTLRTTAEHPLLCEDGEFRDAGMLVRGDRLPGATITGIETGPDELVYNLRVGAPHTFVASGFVVHNKGGGGGGGFHGGHGSGGSGDPTVFFIIVGVVVLVIFVSNVAKSKQDEDLDFVYSHSAIDKKAAKTRKLLEFISNTDPSVVPVALQQRATETFVKLQECWQSRDYEPMRPLLMPDLFEAHVRQLNGLRRNHEINVIAELHVDSVNIVNVRYTHKENQREFTALITAKATDYYTDDRTQEFLRGDQEPAQFQEFWTFQQQDGAWLLREIEQSRESDALKDDNFFEPFTDKGRDQIYAEAAGQEGPAGPWLEENVETKATRIERMLNFLVQTDKLWDRQLMLQRARDIFTKVLLARESGNSGEVTEADLAPALAQSLREEIERRGREGITLEFHNLCVRKVELILVQNYADSEKDKFTTRISAHAQKIVKQNGQTMRADEYVTPFEEFWVFGRLDNQWKLKEVLPPSRGEEALTKENLDEDSSRQQVEWYYKHTRAN